MAGIAYAWFNRDRIYELRVIGTGGSGMRVLHSHPERRFVQPCAWTADGKRILTLFFRGDNVSQIALVDAASDKVDVLKSLDWIYPNRMDLSSDGKWIAYDDLIRKGDTRRTIHLLATDGSARSGAAAVAHRRDIPPVCTWHQHRHLPARRHHL